jgi:hypothetical protein
MANKDTSLMEINSDGTAGISFHATSEYGNFLEIEEVEDSGKQDFTREDFEQALKKVSRKVNR